MIAYILPADGANPTAQNLREHATNARPSYMIPAKFVRLASLPLSVNGKVDRSVLRVPVVGGKQIRKGDMMTVVLNAANRFTDPDTLDLAGTENRRLSFGWATRYFPAAPFNRLMGQVGFEALLRSLPGLHLLTHKPKWRAMASLRGIASLPVAFDAKAAVSLRGDG